MKFVDISFAGLRLRGRLLEDRAPAASAALWKALPLEGRAFQDQYSSQVMRITSRLDVDATQDRWYGYQQLGLLMLDPLSGQLALCFGRGRLHNALGPIAAVPLAEIGGDLGELNERGERLQFDGAQPVVVSAAEDQISPLADPPPRGRRIALTLNSARAEAVLLEEVSPRATAALAAALPLEGRATNTYASGPLTRFWNSRGGREGETPLEVPDEEVNTSTLYGGGYYLNTRPWRGIRISAQEPTAMGGGRSLLAPLFRFAGDWSAFAEQAGRLTMEGQRELRIELA
ncbi:MAG: DUF3830 family protein [Chloroflexota bacterium]|nr:DUF3830 family protein [Chloroflexota bacterium]